MPDFEKLTEENQEISVMTVDLRREGTQTLCVSYSQTPNVP